MKILSVAFLLMASLAFVLVGCADNSSPIATPTDQALSTAASHTALAKGGAVGGKAEGGGAYNTPDPSTDFSSVKFGFTALKYRDDKYGGQLEMDLVGLDPSIAKKIHGTVKGVKFEGKLAMFWAELQTDFAVDYFPGATWRIILVVTDNGEGKKADPDRMSNPWLTSEDLAPGEFETAWALSPSEFLAFIPGNISTPADYPLAHGNIQVREK